MEFKYEQDLVRALLREQHPDLADLELQDVNGGWGNQAVAPRERAGRAVAAHGARAISASD